MSSNEPFVRTIETLRQRAEREFVSIKDLAAELGVSVRTLRRWNNRPDAPQRAKGRRRHMYRREDVQQWLERSKGKLGTKDDAPVDGGSD